MQPNDTGNKVLERLLSISEFSPVVLLFKFFNGPGSESREEALLSGLSHLTKDMLSDLFGAD